MSPEQRLTIREAVDLIAERGSEPITEAALRARIRARRVGVVRIGGRVYTNPLNLVTAGLLPVEVLDGVTRAPRAEIDDAELHAWLNPPGEDAPGKLEPLRAPERVDDPEPGPAVTDRPSSAEATVERGTAGPLERALTDDAETPDVVTEGRVERPDEDLLPDGTEAAGAGASVVSPESGRGRTRLGQRRKATALLVSLAALAAGVLVAIGGEGDRAGTVAEIRGASLVRVASALDRSLARAGERAAERGDYDAALELAGAAGNEPAMDRWRQAAARIVLARARQAAADGRLREARQHLRVAQARYDDPLPNGRRSVLARVDRAERAARRRAAARSARDIVPTPTVVVASPPAESTSGGGAGGSSTSESSVARSGTAAGSGGSGSRPSGSGSGKGPGEFF